MKMPQQEKCQVGQIDQNTRLNEVDDKKKVYRITRPGKFVVSYYYGKDGKK
jgi:hypothetical protein